MAETSGVGREGKILIAGAGISRKDLESKAQESKVEPGSDSPQSSARGGKNEAPQPEPEKKKEEAGFNSASFAKGVFAAEAAEVATHIGKAAFNEGARIIRSKIHGGSGERRPPKFKSPESKNATDYFDQKEKEIAERLSKMRSFGKIQEERAKFISSPNPKKEKKLRDEVERLIAIADEVAIGEDIKELHEYFEKVQREQPFNVARDLILHKNTTKMETTARGRGDATFGWNDKFLGILGDYQSVAILYMDRARLQAEQDLKHADHRAQIRGLNNQIRTRAWGNEPGGLKFLAENFVRENIRRDEEERVAIESRRTARGEDPIDRLNRNLERLVPDPERQREEFRNLEESCAEVVQIPALTSNIWEGLSHDEKNLWQIRLTLLNARAKKQIASKPEELLVPEIMNMTREQADALTSCPGVSEALGLYTLMVSKPDYTESIKDYLDMTTTMLIENVNEPAKLNIFRNELRDYLSYRLGLDQVESRDAEQIAYNLFYMLGLVEKYDIEDSQKIPQVANNTLKDMMRPVTHMVNDAEKGKAWPASVLGSWVRNHARDINKVVRRVPFTNSLLPAFVSSSFEKQLTDIGVEVVSTVNLPTNVDWSKSGGTPFLGYYLNKVSPAGFILNLISQGSLPPGKTPADLGNAIEKLGSLDHTSKATLVFMLYNKDFNYLNPANRDFVPNLSPFAMAGLWSRAKREISRKITS